MKPVSQRRRTLSHALRIVRRNQVPPREAWAKARQMVRQLEGMEKFKRMGMNSEFAHENGRMDRELRRIQKAFLSRHPGSFLGRNKAKIVRTLIDFLRSQPGFSEARLIDVFAKLRFEASIMPQEFFEGTYARVKSLYQEICRELGIAETDEGEALLFLNVLDFSPFGETPLSFSSFGEHRFFRRIRAENGELRTENQRIGLRSALENCIHNDSLTRGVIQQLILNVEVPSQETIDEVRAKVRGFDLRTEQDRKRIVQDWGERNLGNQLAGFMRRNAEKTKRQFEELSKVLPLPVHNDRVAFEQWILECLERPENRKYLVRLVQEWFF